MDDYAQIYWLDERNAREHRGPAGRGPAGGWRPGGGAGSGSAPAQSVQVIRYPNPAQVPAGYTTVPTGYVMQPMSPDGVLMPQAPARYLGGLALGQIIEIASQVLAALQPLPAAPVATKEATTDVGNLVLYQSALATHAKRDEQLRTLGSLISKLVK